MDESGRITLRADASMLRLFKLIGTLDKRSMNYLIVEAMRNWLKDHPRLGEVTTVQCACSLDVTCNMHRKRGKR